MNSQFEIKYKIYKYCQITVISFTNTQLEIKYFFYKFSIVAQLCDIKYQPIKCSVTSICYWMFIYILKLKYSLKFMDQIFIMNSQFEIKYKIYKYCQITVISFTNTQLEIKYEPSRYFQNYSNIIKFGLKCALLQLRSQRILEILKSMLYR
jgi:hypothetical protein